ncbi:MAG: hypothetical protein QXE38_03725 [Candidatus Methanomethylicia archaeon]
MAKRHYPPSYYRYRESHPAISIRLSKDLKEALDAYRGNLSYSEAIRKLLTEKAEIIKSKAENVGYEEENETSSCNVYPIPLMDKLFGKACDVIVNLLDVAEKNGINPKIVEWDIASDVLNIYPVKLKCPWCNIASDIEKFKPIF